MIDRTGRTLTQIKAARGDDIRPPFAARNFLSVTVSLLSFRISAPHAILIAIVYLLGMITGGSVWALIRRAFERARST